MPQQCDINKKWSIASACRNIVDRVSNKMPRNAVNLSEYFGSINERFNVFIMNIREKSDVNINQEEAGDITYGELAVAVGDLGYNVPTSSCYRYLKGIGAVTTSSWVKPSLTFQNKMQRLRWVLKQIDSSNPEDLKFLSQENRIHIDEK